MGFQDLIQHCVVAGNQCWPVAQLNRAAYHAAVHAFVSSCRRIPSISSAYLLHSMAQDQWVAGLSDIDLTLVIEEDLTAEDEFSLLNRFWRTHDRLRKVFPMLGHMNVLTPNRLASWTLFAQRGFEASQWRLLFGDHAFAGNRMADTEFRNDESLNFAMNLYHCFFPGRLFESRSSRLVFLAQLQRVTDKICRYAAMSDTQPSGQQHKHSRVDEFDDLSRIIEVLEDRTREFLDADRSVAEPVQSGPAGSLVKPTILPPQPTTTISADAAVVHSVTASDDECFLVFKDGLDRDTICNYARSMLPRMRLRFGNVFAMSTSTFEYMLRFNSVDRYFHLAKSRSVLFGHDLLQDLTPPTRRSRVRCMLRQTTNVVECPGARFLHKNFQPALAQSLAHRALYIKVCFDSGDIPGGYSERLTECRRRFPHEVEAVRTLLRDRSRDGDRLRFQWFVLLRRLADGLVDTIAGKDVAALTA